jgi:glycosyltransferase involved in cell wall biosynthesis
MISAIVLTKNEEKNIKKCLKSLHQLVDEIIVIDDFSHDKTVKIAQDLGAKVYQRKLNNDFSCQRNFGLQKAKGKWVFFLDADERVSSRLKAEILKNLDITLYDRGKLYQGVVGFELKRKDKFLGKWLRFGETGGLKLVRLARKEAGKWQRPIHEVWQLKGQTAKLKNPLIHEKELTLDEFLKKIDRYSSLRAKELYKKRVRTNAFLIMAYPVGKFWQNYFFRLGFLDGQPGLVMAVMMSLHSFLVRAKLYLLWKNKGREEFKIPSLKEIHKKYG